jgi:hypothetical protein
MASLGMLPSVLLRTTQVYSITSRPHSCSPKRDTPSSDLITKALHRFRVHGRKLTCRRSNRQSHRCEAAAWIILTKEGVTVGQSKDSMTAWCTIGGSLREAGSTSRSRTLREGCRNYTRHAHNRHARRLGSIWRLSYSADSTLSRICKAFTRVRFGEDESLKRLTGLEAFDCRSKPPSTTSNQ